MLITTLLLAACAASEPTPLAAGEFVFSTATPEILPAAGTSQSSGETSLISARPADLSRVVRAADTQPPVITFEMPIGNMFPYGPLTFRLKATDDAGLASIILTSDDGQESTWLITAEGTLSETHEFTLSGLWPSTHTITATAVDRAGKRRSATKPVTIQPATIDRETPRIDIVDPVGNPSVVATTVLAISGRVFDDTRLTSLEWRLTGATTATGTMTPNFTWAANLPPINEGRTTLTITAKSGAETGTKVITITGTAKPTGGGGGGGGDGTPPAKETSGAICGVGSGVASLLLLFSCVTVQLIRRRIE